MFVKRFSLFFAGRNMNAEQVAAPLATVPPQRIVAVSTRKIEIRGEKNEDGVGGHGVFWVGGILENEFPSQFVAKIENMVEVEVSRGSRSRTILTK